MNLKFLCLKQKKTTLCSVTVLLHTDTHTYTHKTEREQTKILAFCCFYVLHIRWNQTINNYFFLLKLTPLGLYLIFQLSATWGTLELLFQGSDRLSQKLGKPQKAVDGNFAVSPSC